MKRPLYAPAASSQRRTHEFSSLPSYSSRRSTVPAPVEVDTQSAHSQEIVVRPKRTLELRAITINDVYNTSNMYTGYAHAHRRGHILSTFFTDIHSHAWWPCRSTLRRL